MKKLSKYLYSVMDPTGEYIFDIRKIICITPTDMVLCNAWIMLENKTLLLVKEEWIKHCKERFNEK